MTKLSLLALSLLLAACRAPSTGPGAPPSPPKVVASARPLNPGPTQLQVELSTDAVVADAEALQQELRAAVMSQLSEWHPVEVPVDSPRSATIPRLKVRVKKYQAKPAGSPFTVLGFPGLVGMGAGLSVIQATAGAQEMGALPAFLIGVPLLGLGLTALALGITFESRKSYLDHKRGYPLHSFQAETRIVWPVGGGLKQEKESYRAFNLGSEARPMSAQDAADPAEVRREMMRALAHNIRLDLGKKTGWGEPEEN